MNLADRIARLEARFASSLPMPTPESFPVLAITLRGEPEDEGPYRIEHGGQQWEQRAGETVRELHARVHGEALESFESQGKYPVLITVAQQQAAKPALGGKTSCVDPQTFVAPKGALSGKE